MPPFARLTWFRVVLALMLGLPGIASTDIRLPSVIADGMVIQRGIRAPIWGTAVPGETVTVQLGARKIATTADTAGANLFSGSGLPASPFRTDMWPGVTVEAKW